MNGLRMSDALIAVGSMLPGDIEALQSKVSHVVADDVSAALVFGRGTGPSNFAEKASRLCSLLDLHIEQELQTLQRWGILVGNDLTNSACKMADARTWIRLTDLRIALREAQEFLALEHGALPWRGETVSVLAAPATDGVEHALLDLLRQPVTRARIIPGSDERVVHDFVLGRLGGESLPPKMLADEECDRLLSGCTDTSHHHAMTVAIARFLLSRNADAEPAGSLHRARVGVASIIQHADDVAAGLVHSTHGYRGQLWT